MSHEQFLAVLREKLMVPGGKKVWRRIAVVVHAAAADPAGSPRDAITERAAFAYQDWTGALAALADVESHMLAVLDELSSAVLP